MYIQSMHFPVITYGMALYINDRYVYRQNTNIEKIYVYASERAQKIFLHFYILKLLFLSIFCWYFRYFVGTNDMLVGLHVATNFEMYRQNSEKALLGGGGNRPPALPPPPPPGYANGWQCQGSRYMNWPEIAKRAANLKIYCVQQCFYVELNALYYFHCIKNANV